MSWDIEHLKFCAYCPNPCRSAIEDTDEGHRESQTPSALSLIAVLVDGGVLAWDREIERALADTATARECRPACPYGYDIAGEIEAFREAHGESA